MIKILVAIPCLTGAEHCKEAIDSVIGKENVDVLLLNNGAELAVAQLIETYRHRNDVIIFHNPTNVFVNPAWNQFMEFFLEQNEWTHLVIMNSDLVMQKDWDLVCKDIWEHDPNRILIPVMSNDKLAMSNEVITSSMPYKQVYEGTAGVFITMNRKQCQMVYPIPEKILVWFGDNWIYSTLRCFYQTVIPDNLISFHHWSQTIQRRPEVYDVIEKDKVEWETNVSNQMINKIEQLKKQTK